MCALVSQSDGDSRINNLICALGAHAVHFEVGVHLQSFCASVLLSWIVCECKLPPFNCTFLLFGQCSASDAQADTSSTLPSINWCTPVKFLSSVWRDVPSLWSCLNGNQITELRLAWPVAVAFKCPKFCCQTVFLHCLPMLPCTQPRRCWQELIVFSTRYHLFRWDAD